MNEDVARRRFLVMNAARLSGAILALIALLIIAGKLDLPVEIGYFLFIFGLIEMLFLPTILARSWKSPPS